MYYREEMGNRDGDTCKIQMKTKQNKIHPVTFHLLGHIVEQKSKNLEYLSHIVLIYGQVYSCKSI